MTTPRPRWACRELMVVCLLLCLSLLALAPTAGAGTSRHGRSHHAGPSHSTAAATRTPPRRLMSAARRANRADRVLVADAKKLKRCLSRHRVHPKRCNRARNALQKAGSRFARAQRRLAPLARAGKPTSMSAASASKSDSQRVAPQLTVSGQTLNWTRIAGIKSYVLVTKVPGQSDLYSVVNGTSFTPPPVPGATVRYAVRTTTWWSAWSQEVSISYPQASEQPKPPSEQPRSPDKQAAPSLSVSGQTLNWNQVAGVTTYVFVRKVPGQSDQYSEVSGTSVTPSPVPGTTVKYSVRTAVEGSAWAPEVAISYAASTPPPPPSVTPAPTTEGTPEGLGSMMVGLDTGGWISENAVNDFAGAVKYVRSNVRNYSDDTHMGYLAKAGVTLEPLLEDGGNGSPPLDPSTEALTWCKRYCKGGTYWAGKTDLGATTLEVVNEPGNPYFWGPNARTEQSHYAAIVEHVASTLKSGLPAGQPQPRLLVSYDGGFEGDAYGRALVKADPNLLNLNIGWTVHPYGGKSSVTQSALGGRIRVTEAYADTHEPVYVTEVGWPTALGLPATGDSLQWTESQQAENITNFVGWARGLKYVGAVVYFNYADYGSNDWYGIVNSNASRHKLSYQALKTAASG
jgi:hypothetical protein